MQVGLIPVMPLNDIVDLVKQDRIAELGEKAQEIIDYGYYAESIKMCKEIIGDENLYILTDELLYKNFNKAIRGIVNFLGLDFQKRPPFYRKRAKNSVRNYNRLTLLSFATSSFFLKKKYSQFGLCLHVRGRFSLLIFYLIKIIDNMILKNIFSNKNLSI
ncbi:MAG: hypothetical protein QTN59_07110 [Candidatus Electrothrix communis]|nr:MAG: hypothetical protein QTN59_07110 [Candidatus Electrothrix communis]